MWYRVARQAAPYPLFASGIAAINGCAFLSTDRMTRAAFVVSLSATLARNWTRMGVAGHRRDPSRGTL
jgi:hypothetical protein